VESDKDLEWSRQCCYNCAVSPDVVPSDLVS